MQSVERIIDINAHVQNVTCQVDISAGNSIATIGFTNLGYGTITAIKFNAKGYNSFGDPVLINGKEQFFLIIQDISIGKNEEAKGLKANLPNSDIRKLELVETQICYSDGSVASYEGQNSKKYVLEKYDAYGEEQDIANALKDKFGLDFKFKPVEYAEGWICGCGRFNKGNVSSCTKCGTMKADALKYTSESEAARLIASYKEAEEKRAEARSQASKQKEKEEQKKKLCIGIGVIIAVALACIIIHASIMAKRTTFSSEAEMKAAIAGIYTCYEDSYGFGDVEYQLKINGDTAIKRWYSLGSDSDLDLIIRSYNPKNGTFELLGSVVVVTNTGDLKYDGSIYKKGGYWAPTLESAREREAAAKKSASETGYTALQIMDVKVKVNSVYTICTGTIKNTGSKTYSYVEVKGSFKDSNGNVIDTDWTYAVGSEGLAPNESSTFSLSVPKNYNITKCTVTILDYD